jgi:hypothetical protein
VSHEAERLIMYKADLECALYVTAAVLEKSLGLRPRSNTVGYPAMTLDQGGSLAV